MRCVIMQPTYLPWAGCFNLMAMADFFVFLDDVQFEKQSWQNRNRILLNGQPHWLTVPVKRNHLSDKIKDIIVDDQHNWRNKHLELLRHTYARHPYASEMLEHVSHSLKCSTSQLSNLNTSFIRSTAKLLNLNPNFVYSSELDIHGARSERLLKICNHLGCNRYLSPRGSADYLAEDAVFDNSNVELEFQNFDPQPYYQRGEPSFVSHLSIVDVLANLGKTLTREYVIGSTLIE